MYFNRDRSANRSLYAMFHQEVETREVRRSPAIFRKKESSILRISKMFASFFFDAKARLWRDTIKDVSEIAHFLAVADSEKLQN